MFAELVLGPPGSGKTTYCEGKRQFVRQFFQQDRHVVLVNLDAANEGTYPYPCDVDVCALVQHRAVMESEGLGPNGSYLFVLEYLAANVDWFIARLRGAAAAAQAGDLAKAAGNSDAADFARPVWFIVDCPGQVECYVNSDALRTLVRAMQQQLRANVVATHLCDGTVVSRDASTYVSTCLLCLTAMVELELPHLNVLSKWDLAVEQAEAQDEQYRAAVSATTASERARAGAVDESERGGYREHPVEALEACLDTGAFLEDGHFDRKWGQQRRRRYGGRDPPPGTPGRARWDKLGAMARSLLETVEGYGLVGFVPLDVQDEASMRSVCDRIDAAAGHLPMT